MRFSVDETKIINMYDTSDRIKLIMDLQQALPHIEDAELTETVSALISYGNSQPVFCNCSHSGFGTSNKAISK